jgi:putative FmdB family regulatory protein
MPKYTFECVNCSTRFTKTLKTGVHPTHGCPECGEEAPRLFDGQSFGFDFAAGNGAPGNSGVSKQDYPTADQAVGRDAEGRWAEIDARNRVKDQVREHGGHRALIRRNGTGFVEYEAGGEPVLERRRQFVKEGNELPEKMA